MEMTNQQREMLEELSETITSDKMAELSAKMSNDISNEGVFKALYKDAYDWMLFMTLITISQSAEGGLRRSQLYVRRSHSKDVDHVISGNTTKDTEFYEREFGVMSKLIFNSPTQLVGVFTKAFRNDNDWWKIYSDELSSMVGKLITELEGRGFSVTETRATTHSNITHHLLNISWG